MKLGLLPENLLQMPPNSKTRRTATASSKETLAWECLKKDYRPLLAGYEDVKKVLANLPDGERSLTCLQDKLQLIETKSFGEKISLGVTQLKRVY